MDIIKKDHLLSKVSMRCSSDDGVLTERDDSAQRFQYIRLMFMFHLPFLSTQST